MKTLVLTLDYELYGDGSGDVFEHIIEPTDKILNIANQYNIKLTIFFEVVEYWKLKEEWNKGNKMGYANNPITAIERQLRQAYIDGHDIQLHIHPQWVDAYWGNNKWNVNYNEWRLGNFCRTGEMSLIALMQKGKETIEELIKPVDHSYQCIALRAGGYNIQPSDKIIAAMNNVGLSVDSSIYPGGKEDSNLSNYDYRGISADCGLWRTGCRLEEEGDSNIYELPVTAYPIIRWRKYMSKERIKAIFKNIKSAKSSFSVKTNNSNKQSRLFSKITYFFETEWQTWDYCLFDKSMHKKFFSYAAKTQNRDIFVLVGHPKGFSNEKNFRAFINMVPQDFDFKSLSNLFNNIGDV